MIGEKLNLGIGNDLKPAVEKTLKGEIQYVSAFTNAQDDIASIEVDSKKKPWFTIYIVNYTFPLRERYSIAHELGHLFLHSKFGATSLRLSQTTESIEIDSGNLIEFEANKFANALLMPKQAWREFLADRDPNSLYLDIAAYFNVPLQVVAERAKELNV